MRGTDAGLHQLSDRVDQAQQFFRRGGAAGRDHTIDTEVFEAPRRVGVEAGAWCHTDFEFPQRRWPRMLLRRGVEAADALFGVLDAERKPVPAVALPHGAAEGLRAGAADDDGRMRFLRRTR